MADEQFTLQFEVIGDTESPADPATLGEIAHGVVAELRKEQYNVEPVYTGEKGGELFEVAWKAIEQGANFALLHPTEIATYVTAISTIIIKVKDVQERFTAKRNTPLETENAITNVKSGDSSVIEGDNPEDVTRALQKAKIKNTDLMKMTTRARQPQKRRRR